MIHGSKHLLGKLYILPGSHHWSCQLKQIDVLCHYWCGEDGRQLPCSLWEVLAHVQACILACVPACIHRSLERLFCTRGLFPGTRGRVLWTSFVQSRSVWLYIKSVKLNAVVWKGVCRFSSSEASGSPHIVFISIAARPDENEYHFKPIHHSISTIVVYYTRIQFWIYCLFQIMIIGQAYEIAPHYYCWFEFELPSFACTWEGALYSQFVCIINFCMV